MNNQKFTNIFQDTMMRLEDLAGVKGGQYANETNRLHNFDRAVEITGKNYQSDTGKEFGPMQVCRGFWLKHLVALWDAINGRDRLWTRERCEEVINDIILYLILTKAMFYRANGWDVESKPVKGDTK